MTATEPTTSDRSLGPPPVSVSLDVSAVPRDAVGVGRFALDLVRVMAKRDDVKLSVWCRRNDAKRWLSCSGGAAVVRSLAPSSRPMRLAWEQLSLPRTLSQIGADVHHAPHYTMPEHTSVPCVVTIHDLTFFDHPEWHERTKVIVFRRAIKVAARRAEALLCDSVKTADRLQELFRPRGRVFVVPLGVDLGRFNPRPGVTRSATDGHGADLDITAVNVTDVARTDEQVLSAMTLSEPYVLFLGTLEPRKAVPELVAAFDDVSAKEPELRLVLAGKPGWGMGEIERALASARHRDRIIRTGYVPDDAVPSLLRKAAAVVYPAKEEGFGLPALEALACGTPLVTTSGTVMAEMAGDSALTVPAGSVRDLAEAIECALQGDGRDERRRLGLEVASHHSWESSADAHVTAYRWAAR